MDEKVKIRFPTNKSCELARRAVDAILNVYFEFERPGARKVTARTITVSLPIAKLLPGELERQTADVWDVIDDLRLLDGLPRKRSGTYSYAKEVARGIIKDARYAVDGAVLRARAVHDLERAFEDAYLGDGYVIGDDD
jgi:hypothetical protein